MDIVGKGFFTRENRSTETQHSKMAGQPPRTFDGMVTPQV